MVECDECGDPTGMPYECSYCGRKLCKEHRLPENHECDGETKDVKHPNETENPNKNDGIRDKISRARERASSSKAEPPRKEESSRPSKKVQPDSMTLEPKAKSPFSVLRRNLTYVFLGLMWLTFVIQIISSQFISDATATAIFTLSTEHPEYVWTWVTSIFSHSGLFHIVGNSFVIFFFGRIVEKRLGPRRYVLFFLGTGILAGLSQIGASIALGQTSAVLGASGAGLAILGFVTILRPSLSVFLFPIPLPVPLWLLTTFYAGFSILSITAGGIGAGGIAQLAHLVGLAIGLGYGKHLKNRVSAPEKVELSR